MTAPAPRRSPAQCWTGSPAALGAAGETAADLCRIKIGSPRAP
jgi:hypothetical protein